MVFLSTASGVRSLAAGRFPSCLLLGLPVPDEAALYIQDPLLAQFVVRRVGVLVARQPNQIHGYLSFPSAARRKETPLTALLHTAWSGAIRPLWDGRFTAHSGAEGGIHRPCANCSNTDVALQHGDCCSWCLRRIASCYSPECAKGEFSEVQIRDAAKPRSNSYGRRSHHP